MDPSQPLAFAFFVVLLPGLLAGLLLLALWRLRGRRPDLAWGGAVALGAAYLAGHAASLGAFPGFPPVSSSHSLFFIALAASLAGVLRGAPGVPGWLGIAVWAGLAAGAPWSLLHRLVERWPAGEVVLLELLAGAALFAHALLLESWGSRRGGTSAPLVLWLAAAATAGALVLGGTASYAQFAASLAAVLGGAVVFAWIAPAARFGQGALVPVATVHACLCLAGVFLAEVPLPVAVVLFLAPQAVWVDRLGPLASLGGAKAVLLRLGAAAVPVAAALAVAWASRPPPSPYGY